MWLERFDYLHKFFLSSLFWNLKVLLLLPHKQNIKKLLF